MKTGGPVKSARLGSTLQRWAAVLIGINRESAFVVEHLDLAVQFATLANLQLTAGNLTVYHARCLNHQ